MEFWNEITTDRSFKLLQELEKKFDFILIGGWAVYFLTKAIKSKDIDIIVDFDTLSEMKKTIDIRKTEFLKKYSAEMEGTDIDIYVPYYSKLIVPINEVMKETFSIEGFQVPRPEMLLLLKQQAEIERKNTIKGQKDRVDILTLLISEKIDFSMYNDLIKKLKLVNYKKRLKEILSKAKIEFEYLGIKNPREIKKIKNKIISELSK